MPDPFGGFGWICQHTVLPQCNLFFYQLYNADTSDDSRFLTTLFPSDSDFYANYTVTGSSARDDLNVQAARNDAGTGVGANCVIPHAGHRGSIGDVALMVITALGAFLTLFLAFRARSRKAAVGRTELRLFLLTYALHCALSVVTMSSVLQQGSTALAVLSAVHCALGVAMFWVLLGNGLVATQVVEDGTPAALVPLLVLAILLFLASGYVSLDTAFTWSQAFKFSANDADVGDLRNVALFVFTLVWPAFAVLAYFVIMLYVVLVVLREVKPALFYILAAVLFAASQIVFFLANQPLCEAANQKINAAFISALLNTASVGMIYLAWQAITEDDWGEEYNGYYQ